MQWRGSKALVLLDEFEKHITKRLLECREEAETNMGGLFREIKPSDRPTEVIVDRNLRPCDCCGAHMEAGCGKKCPGCGWISPCSVE